MKAKTNNIDMTGGTIWRQMLRFCWPMMMGSLFQQLYTTVDAVIVGQFAGKAGLASIDAVSAMLRLPVNLFVGISTGATVIISQYFGAKKEKELGKAIHTAVAFALIAGLFLSVIGVFAAQPAIDMLGVPEDIYHQSLGYVRVYFGGLLVSLLYNVSAGISRAMGNSKTPFRALIVSGILNMILDLVLVGVFHTGAPGAGLATVISQAVSAALVIRMLTKGEGEACLKLKKIGVDREIFANIFKVGFPIGLQSSLYPITNMVIQKSVNAMGTDNIAAWSLCLKLDLIIWLVFDSFGQTTSTFVAQNYGAKQMERAKNGVRTGMLMTVSLIAVISLVLYFFSVPLGRLFLPEEDAYIAEAAGVLMRIMAVAYITYTPTSILSGAIRGTGESFMPMVMTLIGMCAVRLGWAAFVIPLNYTMTTIIWGYPVSWALTSLAFILYYITFGKRRFAR